MGAVTLVWGMFLNEYFEIFVKFDVYFFVLVNGGWGQWSEWKTCNAQCQSIRTRSCDNPEPSNGGRECVGDKLEKTNCTGDICSGIQKC